MNRSSSRRDDRRRLRNLMPEPRRQLRYASHFLLFASLATLYTQWVSYRTSTTVVRRILEQEGLDGALTDMVQESIGVAMLQSAWLLPVIGGFGVAYSAVLLHRFFGPQVSIRRYIRSLADGDYSGECRIRSEDELHAIVEELNELTVRLRDLRHRNAERRIGA